MIKSIRHKGLQKFFETGNTSGIQSKHTEILENKLAALDTAESIEDMNIPGYRLHPLKGKLKGRWSIKVSGNWHLTCEFRDTNVYVLDYKDDH